MNAKKTFPLTFSMVHCSIVCMV